MDDTDIMKTFFEDERTRCCEGEDVSTQNIHRVFTTTASYVYNEVPAGPPRTKILRELLTKRDECLELMGVDT